MKNLCFFAVSALLVQGCATVKTYPYQMGMTNGQGVTYFLPKRTILFSGTRTPTTRDEIDKQIKKLEEAGKSATDALAILNKSKAEIERDLKAPGLTLERSAKLTDDLAITTNAIAVLKAEGTNRDTQLASLRPTLQMMGNGVCVFTYEMKMELQAPVADTSQRLIANLSHSVLRDDDQKFTITTDGLLSSADVTATDRTADIIVEIAGALGAFGVAGPSGGRTLTAKADKADPSVNCQAEVRKFAYMFDPSIDSEVDGLNVKLRNAFWPFAIDVAGRTPALTQSNATFYAAGDDVPAGIARMDGPGSRCPKSPIQNSKWRDRLCPPVDGLLYRTALPLQINMWQCNSGPTCTAGNGKVDEANATPVQSALVSVPQAGPISYIPMRSSAFVKTTDNVVFSNGMLTSWNASRPSEVLEVVRLPVRILKAVVSVPAEILKLRVDYSSQAESLSSGYAKQISANEKLKKLQLCLDLAERNDSDPALCLE